MGAIPARCHRLGTMVPPVMEEVPAYCRGPSKVRGLGHSCPLHTAGRGVSAWGHVAAMAVRLCPEASAKPPHTPPCPVSSLRAETQPGATGQPGAKSLWVLCYKTVSNVWGCRETRPSTAMAPGLRRLRQVWRRSSRASGPAQQAESLRCRPVSPLHPLGSWKGSVAPRIHRSQAGGPPRRLPSRGDEATQGHPREQPWAGPHHCHPAG